MRDLAVQRSHRPSLRRRRTARDATSSTSRRPTPGPIESGSTPIARSRSVVAVPTNGRSVMDRGRVAMAAGAAHSYDRRLVRSIGEEGALMASPAEIVERYFEAWTSKDFETARSLLHDDLSFQGPIETLDNAD